MKQTVTENRLKYWARLRGRKLTPEHRLKVIKTLKPIRKGGTYEEAFGTEVAKQMREKMSLAKLGKKMPWNSVPDRVGEKSPRWKGGISKAYRTGYYSAEYKEWRTKVFTRDDYTCQKCGAKKYVTAHHIKSFAHYPKLRYEINNGLTLCELCHSLTDNYKGRNRRRKDT